jgi:hypothetical protein
VTAQRLEKWLKAAEDKAAQDWTVDLHLAHPGRALYLPERRDADECDLHSLYR